MRFFRVLALATLAFSGSAWGVAAQNGLERFEKDVKPQIELEKFNYESAQPLGSSGFVLNRVTAVIPANPATGDKASTVKIDKITVEELDFERLKKGNDDDMPRFAKLQLEGMTGDDEMFATLAPYGVPKVPVDITLDYRLDSARKVFTLNKLEISLRGQARFTLELVLDGITDKASNMESAKDDGRLRSASLTIEDKGLFAKVLPALAKEDGSTAEAYVGMAQLGIAGFSDGQGPATMAVLDAIASFIADWKAPKGPLSLGIKPAKTAGFADLDKVMVPNALVEVFGLSAKYDGMRAGAAKAGMTAK